MLRTHGVRGLVAFDAFFCGKEGMKMNNEKNTEKRRSHMRRLVTAALFAAILWDSGRPAAELILETAQRPYVSFA